MGKGARQNGGRAIAKKQNRKGRFAPPRYASIYMLLWAIFSAFTLFLVLLFSFTQRYTMTKAYKSEAANDVFSKGTQIERILDEVSYDVDLSALLRTLGRHYDVRVYLLGNGEQGGQIYFPNEPSLDESDWKFENKVNFTEEVPYLIKKLERADKPYVTYERNGVYVYAAEMVSFGGEQPMYLYVGQSLALLQTVNAEMNMRMVLVAVFTFVLGFAIASAIAGWLAKPLSEMSEKAHLLAQGNFQIDFRGDDYAWEFVELADTLNFARDELAKTDGMQKELIANVSHDFKTPLTMIKAYASMIMEISGDIPEKRNKHAQVIVDEADRLTSLVNDVLDLSKIRSGIGQFKQEILDMSAQVHDVLDRFSYLKETQKYQFFVDVEEGLYTRADSLRIGQAMYNLIGNAVNYTGEDKAVYVQLKKETESTFRFSVRDTGKGIKQEELAGIWERYYRSTEAHKRPVQGTGLGLSIVKTVLQQHRFEFGVQSEEGKGSTFYILFPLMEKEG